MLIQVLRSLCLTQEARLLILKQDSSFRSNKPPFWTALWNQAPPRPPARRATRPGADLAHRGDKRDAMLARLAGRAISLDWYKDTTVSATTSGL